MVRNSRVHNQRKLNLGLKLIFIISATVLLACLVFLPKTNCEACKLPYNERFYDVSGFMALYEESCLEGYREPKNPFYVNLDDLNITYKQNMTIITLNNGTRNE